MPSTKHKHDFRLEDADYELLRTTAAARSQTPSQLLRQLIQSLASSPGPGGFLGAPGVQPVQPVEPGPAIQAGVQEPDKTHAADLPAERSTERSGQRLRHPIPKTAGGRSRGVKMGYERFQPQDSSPDDPTDDGLEHEMFGGR